MANPFEDLVFGVRSILHDYAARNKLLGSREEYSDDDIQAAIQNTLDEINYGDVYHTKYTLESIMRSNPYLIKLGVAKTVLFSRMMEKTRNYMPYSDGAGYVDKEGNLAQYQSMYSQMAEKYDSIRRTYKARLNIHNAMR